MSNLPLDMTFACLHTELMAKRKTTKHKVSHSKVHHAHSSRYAHDDKALMILAGAAAIVVGFFAVFAYKSNSIPMPTATPNQIMTVNLETQNKSGEIGTATLQEVDGKVVVTIATTGFAKNVTQPAHIHIGSCPTPGAVKYPLTSVMNGQSVTTIDTTLSDLKAMGPLALNLHKSVAQSSIYTSCGDLSL